MGVTPDGSEVWVGNTLSGSFSVIGTDTDALVATIPGEATTSALGAALTDIVFAPVG